MCVFPYIVDINSAADDMLCFHEDVPGMPVKSGKNPFAFLKKSDYNDTQTVF